MKLTQMSNEVYSTIKNTTKELTVDEIATLVGRSTRSVNANITDLSKKGLVAREKRGEGDEAKTYVVLTDEGRNFVPTEE